MRKLLLTMVLLLAGGWLVSAVLFSTPAVRVLFIGNSYTYYNDMPLMMADIAQANGVEVEVTVIAKGGYFLSQHAGSAAVQDAIGSENFDIIVLQEQSIAPAEPNRFETDTMPAIRRFSSLTAESPARVILFQTWGHRDGNPISGHRSYESMQGDLILAYATMATEIDGDVAPVGSMWWRARTTLPDVTLHAPDGSHPTAEGSYLAAAVIAGVVADEPPTIAADGYIDGQVAQQLIDLLN